jgi:fructose-1-phosphate kinase PfkB-like protein
MASELGAEPVLCGFAGGETGVVLEPLLARLPVERRLVATGARTGCYVVDRRNGDRKLLGAALADAPDRHEIDDLLSETCTAALLSDLLVVCNPYPGDHLPLDSYPLVVGDAREHAIPVIVDLSSPRLDAALEARPDIVKLNDWELAQYVAGPVDGLDRLRAAAERLLKAGAGAVIVTRGGDPALVVRGDQTWELASPRFSHGSREGCGDSMTGALAAALARGEPWEDALVLAAAAGAANFLRHGLGTGTRAVVERLARDVELRPIYP